jgi:hypothetical protein
MSNLIFLLDENISRSLRDGLSRRWPEMIVWMVGDPGLLPRGTPDPVILQWCEAHHFALITYNRASMPIHLKDHLTAGHHISGIFVLRGRMSIGQVLDALGTIWLSAESVDYTDQITYVKPPES